MEGERRHFRAGPAWLAGDLSLAAASNGAAVRPLSQASRVKLSARVAGRSCRGPGPCRPFARGAQAGISGGEDMLDASAAGRRSRCRGRYAPAISCLWAFAVGTAACRRGARAAPGRRPATGGGPHPAGGANRARAARRAERRHAPPHERRCGGAESRSRSMPTGFLQPNGGTAIATRRLS